MPSEDEEQFATIVERYAESDKVFSFYLHILTTLKNSFTNLYEAVGIAHITAERDAKLLAASQILIQNH
jgi:hypothetical protein